MRLFFRRCAALGIALMVLVSSSGCLVLLYESEKEARKIAALHGKEFSFRVSPAPPFLSEELALGTAWKVLSREGFDTNQWQLVRSGRPGKDPEGRPDSYFQRMRLPTEHSSSNSYSQVRGTLRVRNGDVYRRFEVRLDGSRIYSKSLNTGAERSNR